MIYTADPQTFDPQCTSKFRIADAHKSNRDGKCVVCLRPSHSRSCCCNCFSFDWPGFSQVDMVCQIGADLPLPVILHMGQLCNEARSFIPGEMQCAFSGSYGGVTASLLQVATVDGSEWSLTISLCGGVGGVVLTYLLEDDTAFTCKGGLFVLDSMLDSTNCVLLPSFPSEIDVVQAPVCFQMLTACGSYPPHMMATYSEKFEKCNSDYLTPPLFSLDCHVDESDSLVCVEGYTPIQTADLEVRPIDIDDCNCCLVMSNGPGYDTDVSLIWNCKGLGAGVQDMGAYLTIAFGHTCKYGYQLMSAEMRLGSDLEVYVPFAVMDPAAGILPIYNGMKVPMILTGAAQHPEGWGGGFQHLPAIPYYPVPLGPGDTFSLDLTW